MYMTARSRRLARFAGLSALAAIALAFAILFGLLSNETPSSAAFGPFAGYVWRGHVKSLRGSWTVPRVLGGSPGARAGTWIGAQASGNPGPFIQVGSDELEASHPGDAPEARYEAFWSDVSHGFHPQALFRVNPGDDISASLTLAHKRWTLAIVDLSSGAAAHFSTGAEAHASFNEADWTQEDESNDTNKPFPYPHLTAVSFRGLAVNAAVPSSADLSARWMSANGENLAPSPLRHDSFALQRAPKISGAGAQYLRIARPEDAADYAFSAELARWTAQTPHSRIASASSKFAAALSENIEALRRARWPASVQAPVESLIADLRPLLDHVRSAPSGSSGRLVAWKSALEGEMEAGAVAYAGDAVRRLLGVPIVPVM
jgi:Peptidase A4 family